MGRVYYPYHQWEEYTEGMWRITVGPWRKMYRQNAERLMRDPQRFSDAMLLALDRWPISSEMNLSCTAMNRRAWIGHAACCIAAGAPEDATREAWWNLTDELRAAGDAAADRAIEYWEKTVQMPKTKMGINVLEAAQQRIEWTFDNFERVYTSFSGGKDSTVMLHLVMAEAIKRQRKVGMMFVDLEGQYKLTIDHVREMVELYGEWMDTYWVCLPIALRNAVSVYQPQWICWQKGKEDCWIREPPEGGIFNETKFPFFVSGMEFEDFVPAFGEWYSEGELTACMVGIRSDESLNRFRSIARDNKDMLQGKKYTTKVSESVYNVYPVYDWKTSDIWIYHAKTGLCHNELYDRMHQAGLTINQMRICQPYGDDQRRGLWLFHLIEPETWSRVVARVNGANSGALYVQEWGNINGYRKISKPKGHTWKSFATLLVKSMPPKTQEHFENKIFKFIVWWGERGYPDGIPDAADYALEAKRKAPSWRRVCKSLLRNDYWCKGIGFSQHKTGAYEKYLKLMKRKREAAAWKL
jgi:predicted phosphoadenosine phosphosulfate sulfurtransferase